MRASACLSSLWVARPAYLLVVQWSSGPCNQKFLKKKKNAITENYSQRRVSERAGQAVEELVLSPDAQLWSLNPRADRGAISAESLSISTHLDGSPRPGRTGTKASRLLPEMASAVGEPRTGRPASRRGKLIRLSAQNRQLSVFTTKNTSPAKPSFHARTDTDRSPFVCSCVFGNSSGLAPRQMPLF